MKKFCVAVGTMILAAGLGITGCSNQNQAAEGETVAVQSVAMLAGLDSSGLQNRYAGVVVAQATYEINKEEDRTIEERFVDVGDEVQAGDVLFSYDTDEIQLSIDTGELEMEKIKNTISSTKTQITKLESEKRKAPSSEQLSYSIEIQSLEADIKENEYNLNTKKIELERLEKTLENSEVVAEADGIVQSVNENGETDDYGNPKAFIVLMETGTYRVKGTVNETNMGDIGMMEGSPVIIRSRIDNEQTWSAVMGSVDMENPVSDNNYYYYSDSDETTQSSKYAFYVDLDSSEGLMMGQHVYIELDQGQDEEKEGIWISSYYLNLSEEENYVWAANDKDKLEKRSITLGEYDADMDCYQILEGLSEEDYIAIPDETLQAGMPVTRYDEEYFAEPDYGDMEGYEEEGMEGYEGEDLEGYEGEGLEGYEGEGLEGYEGEGLEGYEGEGLEGYAEDGLTEDTGDFEGEGLGDGEMTDSMDGGWEE
ncbi:MAG: efflux RND transporter periplasmic adaptor subunit [Clostridiales bacterium]|nr:efflux RND transporter periplasmic adaptor subunit [Clostridiales bacterium]